MSESFSNVYADRERADAYAQLEFPGTYFLAFRDLPTLIRKHITGADCTGLRVRHGAVYTIPTGFGFLVERPQNRNLKPFKSRAVEELNTNELNPKQLRFCKEYVVDYNGAQAAIRSGYSKNSARVIASQLLTKLNIKGEVERLEREKADQLGIRKERIMCELAYLGFSNMADYMRVDPQGYPRLDFTALSREQAAALTEITVDEYVEPGKGKDDPGSRCKKVKFKLGDKRAALVDLGKHIGMFRDRDEKGTMMADKQQFRWLAELLIERKANGTEI